MELMEKKCFLDTAQVALGQIYDQIASVPSISWQALDGQKLAVIVLDMINGFAKEGALASPRVLAIINENVRICRQAQALGAPVVAFNDAHTPNSPEFLSFPPHCLLGTAESELVAELAALEGVERIEKNSTNGFLEPAFRKWLETHSQIDQFILIGDCTDICVLQMAQSLKAWFNRKDQTSRLIVPLQAVDTYTLGEHDGDLLNVLALYLLKTSGVELVQTITV